MITIDFKSDNGEDKEYHDGGNTKNTKRKLPQQHNLLDTNILGVDGSKRTLSNFRYF